jgi:hypothetical protein
MLPPSLAQYVRAELSLPRSVATARPSGYLKQNYLSNRVFKTYEDIVDACCEAWNKLMAMPDRIASICTREWARAVTT